MAESKDFKYQWVFARSIDSRNCGIGNGVISSVKAVAIAYAPTRAPLKNPRKLLARTAPATASTLTAASEVHRLRPCFPASLRMTGRGTALALGFTLGSHLVPGVHAHARTSDTGPRLSTNWPVLTSIFCIMVRSRLV